MRPKRKILVGLLCLLVFLMISPGLSGAQEKDLKISDLKVDIWPEYDDPRVMVQYGGEFADKKKTPDKVAFLIPKEAEDIHACAVTDKGEHQCNAFEKAEKDGLYELTYDLKLPKFAVMFYYNAFKNKSTQKNFNFLFKTTYFVNKLAFDIQQPLKASNFEVSPSANNTTSDEKGFKYFLYSYDSVTPGKEIGLGVKYAKSDPKPSVDKGTQTGGKNSTSKTRVNPWVILAVVAGLIILPLGGYFLATARAPVPAQRTTPRFTPPRGKKGKTRRFCTSCGTSVDSGDSFCPKCGRRIKQ